MIGRLGTVVLDAADMRTEAQFWSKVLDVTIVDEEDWATLEGRGVRLAVQLAPDHVPAAVAGPGAPSVFLPGLQQLTRRSTEAAALEEGHHVGGVHFGSNVDVLGEAVADQLLS